MNSQIIIYNKEIPVYIYGYNRVGVNEDSKHLIIVNNNN